MVSLVLSLQALRELKGIVHHFFSYRSNLIIWIVMGCGTYFPAERISSVALNLELTYLTVEFKTPLSLKMRGIG